MVQGSKGPKNVAMRRSAEVAKLMLSKSGSAFGDSKSESAFGDSELETAFGDSFTGESDSDAEVY